MVESRREKILSLTNHKTTKPMSFNVYSQTPATKALTKSKKKKIYFCGKKHPVDTASYWSGGSKSNYKVINLVTKETKMPPAGVYPMFQAEYAIAENEIVLETGISEGKEATPTIHCRAEDEEKIKEIFGLNNSTLSLR